MEKLRFGIFAKALAIGMLVLACAAMSVLCGGMRDNDAAWAGQTGDIGQEAALTPVPASVTLKAGSIQMLYPDICVHMRLQVLDGDDWRDVDAHDATVVDSEKISTADGLVTLTFSDFFAEMPMLSDSGSVLVAKYDATTGEAYTYRWIENELSFDNGANWKSVYTTVGSKETDDIGSTTYTVSYGTVSADDICAGAGDDSLTTAFIIPESRVTVDAAGSAGPTETTNTLAGETMFAVSMTWIWPEGEDVEEPDSSTVTITGSDRSSQTLTVYKRDEWKGAASAERFDSDGCEIDYSFKEAQVNGWHSDTATGRAVESGTDTDYGFGDVLTMTADVAYSIPAPSSWDVDIKLSWEDDCDSRTRPDVVVGLFDKEGNPYPNSWDQLTATITEKDNWFARISLEPEDEWQQSYFQDHFRDFSVRELSMGGASADYTNINYRYSCGTVVEPSGHHNLQYDYLVENIPIIGAQDEGSHVRYEVKNTRIGTVNLMLDKNWVDEGKTPAATFEIIRKTDTGDAWETVDLPSIDDGVGFSANADGRSFTSHATSGTASASFMGLAKYDADGKLYTYRFRETALGGAAVTDNSCTYQGNTYRIFSRMTDAIIAGPEGHNTQDIYTWSFTTKKMGQLKLKAYIRWLDKIEGAGTTQQHAVRSTVDFHVYRISSRWLTGIGSLYDQVSAALTAYPEAISEAGALSGWDVAKPAMPDTYAWECDLGSVDRYDDDGYPYVYFLKEAFTGVTADNPPVSAENYRALYVNGPASARPAASATISEVRTAAAAEGASLSLSDDFILLGDGQAVNETAGHYGENHIATIMNFIPASMGSAKLDASTAVYNGKNRTPAVTVTLANETEAADDEGGEGTEPAEGEGTEGAGPAEGEGTEGTEPVEEVELIEGTDFAVTVLDAKGTPVSAAVNAGDYTILVTGINDYIGTFSLPFTITPQQLSAAKVTLGTTTYAYDGKAKKPAVIVKNAAGAKIAAGASTYSVAYSANKLVGKATVKVIGKGNYAGTVTKNFTINPAKTSIKTLAKGTKSFKVTWTKKTAQVSGYQIRYSTSSKFTKATTKTVTVASPKTVTKTVKKLKPKKKYYVQVCTYKTVGGKKYCSAWSPAKTVTTK